MQQQYSYQQTAAIAQTIMGKVYGWMALALAATGAFAWVTANSPAALQMIFEGGLVWPLLIGEIVLVMVLSARIHKLSAVAATGMFFVYSILNGITMSVVLLAYTQSSVASTFLVCAGMFGAMSAWGYFTKTDLSSWGQMFFMALIGIILASLVNLFMQSETIYWAITYLGVVLFAGLTAYDTQKIKHMAAGMDPTTDTAHKLAIMGALRLYLDFINLFLFLLRIMGRRR